MRYRNIQNMLQEALLCIIWSWEIKYQILKKSKLPCYKESEIQSIQHQKEKIVFPGISETCKSKYGQVLHWSVIIDALNTIQVLIQILSDLFIFDQ